MKKLAQSLILGSALLASANALPAQQFIFGTQSPTAVSPLDQTNTFGNDVVALRNTVGAPPILVVNDAAYTANSTNPNLLNLGQAAFYNFDSAPLTAPLKRSFGSGLTEFFAFDMVGVGDVDSDGWEDVAVGAPQVGVGPGYFRVISGNPAVLPPADVLLQVNGPTPGSSFYGGGLDLIDIGQGGRDILVASLSVVEVRDEVTGARLAGPFTLPAGFGIARSLNSFTERFSIRTLGDLNSDGLDDFAVGSSSSDQVLVLDGNPSAFGTTLATLNGPAGTNFGYALAPMGDVTGDGVVDFLVGAPGDSSNQGRVYLYDGSSFGIVSQITGNNPEEFFGYSVDGGLDLDGDGTFDGIIGAPGSFFPLVAGFAQTVTGSTLTPLYGATTSPPVPAGLAGPRYGTSVALLGDLNGDAFSEYSVSLAQDSQAPLPASGHNFVYAGGPLATLTPLGTGCSSNGSPPPTLGVGGQPFLGATLSGVAIDPTNPGALGAYFLGFPGTIPPCFDLTGPITLGNFTLNGGGVAILPALTVPMDPSLLGLRVRFQLATTVTGGFNVSNSFEAVIGLR